LYHLPHAESNSDIEIRFNRDNLAFDCFDSDGKFIDYVLAKGLDFNELSGDLIDFIKWSDLQTLFKH
jgi:hypothetical protein